MHHKRILSLTFLALFSIVAPIWCTQTSEKTTKTKGRFISFSTLCMNKSCPKNIIIKIRSFSPTLPTLSDTPQTKKRRLNSPTTPLVIPLITLTLPSPKKPTILSSPERTTVLIPKRSLSGYLLQKPFKLNTTSKSQASKNAAPFSYHKRRPAILKRLPIQHLSKQNKVFTEKMPPAIFKNRTPKKKII